MKEKLLTIAEVVFGTISLAAVVILPVFILYLAR